ncbi:PrsW family intramembrane metalloprotease [Nostoc sp. CHAB 5714]|uniref:PrsW family intramembrane metalloprotease n=1 Tax=Nostoc favosum CHAB5714 TaxID=2780399 RepID=A0ABS8IK98_9NOSO|nr:PrsW family intramembrane metalloprotease [Nostoc favosum CHAB5714]
MHGIWGAAIAATLVMAGAFGLVLWRFAPRAHVGPLLLALALQLPMCAVAYYLVRQPIIDVLQPLFGQSPIYRWGQFLYAPLTEEPAKLWPALLPFLARRIDRATLAWYGLALGTGFAIGEAWFIGDLIARSGRLADLQWWQFGGYISERILVAPFHAAMVATTLRGWRCWRGGILAGLGVAMLMHLLGNLSIGVFPLIFPAALVPGMLQLFVLLIAVAGALLLVYYATGKVSATIPGTSTTCPKCNATRKRSLLVLNLGFKRLERCPACRRWSVV